MPATRRHHSSRRVPGRFLATDTTTWHLATVSQLRTLPAANLRLHLSARNLVTTGNKTVLVQRLYASIHSDSAAAVTSSPPTSSPASQGTRSPSTSSDSPRPTPIAPAATTTTANNDPVTSTTASNNGSQVTTATVNNAGQIRPSAAGQLQPQYLVNLLCQAALQLSGNLSGSSPPPLLPTDTQAPPAITTQTTAAQTSASNQSVTTSHPSQQEDQLSEASAFMVTNPSAAISSIPTTTSRNHGPLDITPDPTLSLPPVPARLRERIIAGEFIDFNTLLSGAMFSMRESPTLHQAPLPLFTPQGSHQSSSFHEAQTPATIKRINSFALWMEAWNVYLSTLLAVNPSRALELLGYQRLITSANLQLPFSAWMSYDIRFRTLAASNSALRWDIRHPDLWLECLTFSRTATSSRWPCPHCNSLYHFPDRCPFRSSRPSASTPDDGQPSNRGASSNSRSPERRNQQPSTHTYYCRDFNNRGRCTRSHCAFHHLCERCGGSHPKLFCPNPLGQSLPRP